MRNFLEKLRPNFLGRELEKIVVPSCETLLDVGCGENPVSKIFRGKLEKIFGIEMHQEASKKAEKLGIFEKIYNADALDIDKFFNQNSVDCVMVIDLVEHLDKRDALKFISKIEKIAKKLVIIQTTNGFFPQGEYGGNKFQIHKCGFGTEDFQKMGYKVLGMDGPKFLRKKRFEDSDPGIFFSIAANLLDQFFRFIPKKSFNLLVYKEFK